MASVQSLVAVLQQQIHTSRQQDPADAQEVAPKQTRLTYLPGRNVRKYFTVV